MSLTDTITTVKAPVSEAVAKAVEAIDGVLPIDRPKVPQLPEAAEIVEIVFAFIQKVVDKQHDFAKSIVKLRSPAEAPKAAPKPKVAKKAA
jgi:hypothetical protein